MIFVNNNFRKTFLLGFFKHVLSKNILPTRGAPGGPPHQPESVAGWIFFFDPCHLFLCKRSLFFDWSSLLLISLLHIRPFSAAPSLCLTPSLFLTGTSQKNTSHRIASHHIASHRIASHRITSHHIASHHITSHHITSHRIASYHLASHRITSHRIASHHIASHRIISHRIASHHITSHRITSHRIASHHITSHRITSHRITSHPPAIFILDPIFIFDRP